MSGLTSILSLPSNAELFMIDCNIDVNVSRDVQGNLLTTYVYVEYTAAVLIYHLLIIY